MLNKLIVTLAIAIAATAAPALATTLPFTNVSSVSFTTTQIPSPTYPVTVNMTSTNGNCDTNSGLGVDTADLFGPASQFVVGWGNSTQLVSGTYAGGTAAGSYTLKFNGAGCLASGTVTYT